MIHLRLTFKNRSESLCVGLGKEHFPWKDVPIRFISQLAQAQIHELPQLRPLRCVAEGENAGAVGLEEILASQALSCGGFLREFLTSGPT